MNLISSNRLVIAVLIAAALGVLFGLVLPGLMLALSFVGELFVNVLQIIFIPLVGAAIITGVSAFANYRKTARAALATLFLFLGTTVIAIVIGLILVVIFQPGVGINTGTAFIPDEIANAPLAQSLDFLNELVPSNIPRSVIDGKFLGWMIVLTIAATILGNLGQRAKAVTDFFEGIFAVVQKVLEKFIFAVPVGIFFVIGTVIARNSGYLGSLSGALGKLSLVLIIGFLIHALLVIPVLIKFLAHRSPFSYFVNVLPALKTALATSSPTAALAVTYENSVEKNHIDNRVAALVLPVGSSLNVNGRALYVTVCALFIAQAFELNLGFGGTIYVAMAAMFFSLGTAVVPFAAMLTLVAVFDSAGFPTAAYAGIGLVFVVDWFWGRVFAALDVWSDAAVAAVVEENLTGVIARPTRPDRAPAQRYERSGPRRDYRDSRSRPEYRGREQRPERGPRPYSRPEREPVQTPRDSSTQGSPTRRPFQKREPSPFELKSEKEFDIEAAMAPESQTEKPTPVVIKKTASEQKDRRKVREQKRYTRGHETSDSEIAEKRTAPQQSDEVKPPTPKPSAKPVTPPPLIRDLEKSRVANPEPAPVAEKEKPAPAKTEQVEKIEKPAVKPAPVKLEKEEVQTSLFGRNPHRKGTRSKSDTPPQPVEDSETYSTEKQEFGRGTRKKKSK